MELTSSSRLRELVARAREVTETVAAPNAEAEDRDARWPGPAMRALADAGLMGLHVPEDLGGHGEGLSGLVALSETLAQGSASAAMCYAMHCVGTAVIAAKATDHHKEAYLVPIARGEHVTTLALSEPGTGIHFYLPQSLVLPESDHYLVRGTKSFVTNGGEADSYVVSVAAPDEEGAGEGTFSCVLVDEGTPGLRWEEPWAGLGMRGNSSRTVRLEDVPVPRGNLLGEEGDQLWYVFEVVAPYFLMAMAGTYLGVASAAFAIAREHLGTRRYAHSGELLGSSPVLAHRLGELWTELSRTRHLVHAAAARADAGDPDALPEVLACKAAAGDTAVLLTNEAMTLCGGSGYRENGTLARLLRDARASHVMAPTTDILKTWVGRALLGQPLL
ncbi:MAG TPA: acyl-CoA dehydrogenase family protein [Longimicrobiaceae bacterium]|nr:acyl-CoA dehydrogenase family protein [Longimicrobiaceae bacterium]